MRWGKRFLILLSESAERHHVPYKTEADALRFYFFIGGLGFMLGSAVMWVTLALVPNSFEPPGGETESNSGFEQAFEQFPPPICLSQSDIETIRTRLENIVEPAVALWTEAEAAAADEMLIRTAQIRKREVADRLRAKVSELRADNLKLLNELQEGCNSHQ